MATRRIAVFMLAIIVLVFSGPGPAFASQPEETAPEADVRVTAIDFDECEPVHIRATIMEINAVRGSLVVGEREIRLMDVATSKRVIRTAFLSTDGKPEPAAEFQVGQHVSIKGFAHPDGYVAAGAIQKIAKPPAKDGKRKIDQSKAIGKQKAQRQEIAPPAGRK